MLKNVQEAKFNKILIPITNIAIDQSQRSLVHSSRSSRISSLTS